MADVSSGSWSRLNDEQWFAVKDGLTDVGKSGNLAIQCIKCGDGYIIGECSNCGNGTYKIGVDTEGVRGLFCTACNMGLTSHTCDKCGCENPISQRTLVKKGCYIVTATCGISSWEANFFYHFRDEYLLRNRFGKVFVTFYYIVSPFFANIIARYSLLRRLSYNLLVRPVHKLLIVLIGGEQQDLNQSSDSTDRPQN